MGKEKGAEKLADTDEFRLVIKTNDRSLYEAAGEHSHFRVSVIAEGNQSCDLPCNLVTKEPVEIKKGVFKMLPKITVTKETIIVKPGNLVISIERPEREKDFSAYFSKVDRLRLGALFLKDPSQQKS